MIDQPRVLIADDHTASRLGVRAALEQDGWRVVAEAITATQAVHLAKEIRPDVCLLDVHMPGSGTAAAVEICRAMPDTAIVMLTYSRAENDLFDSLRAGAQGYLVKDMDPDRLGPALRGVLAGEAVLPRTLVARVLDEFRAESSRRMFGRRRPSRLTTREWEVMELLRQGLSTDEVAQRLFLSPNTVRVHISSVVKKLRVPDRESALRLLDEGTPGV